MDPERRQNIRGYELHEQIGRGGYGVVYRAHQPLVGRDVAIKIILPQYANLADFIRRFEAEAQLVARLEHLHIVPLYDYWREPDGAYLVMRYLGGGSLSALQQRGPLPLETIARLLDQIGSALEVAHQRGVIHRDLKPANILLDKNSNFFLADFGIAKDLGQDLSESDSFPHSDSLQVVGSPAYMAPEQIKAGLVTPQTDIYSLGIILYELLAGELPFRATTPIEMMFSHVKEPLPPVHERRSDLPPELSDLLERATAKDARERYRDAPALAEAFRRAAGLGGAAGAIALGGTPAMSPASGAPGQRPTSARDTVVLDIDVPLGNPFKGLRAFQEADAPDFFGRAALTRRLLERMTEPGELSRFLAVVGPSGSGKSSAVRAGLVPALRQGDLPGSEHWFVVEMQPGAQPLRELATALLRVAINPPKRLLERLQSDPQSLRRLAPRLLPLEPGVELIVVIDQFEELFTLVSDEATRAHVLDTLYAAVTDPLSRLRVVITLRADFYDRPLLHPDFGMLMRQRTEVVLPLNTVELEQAISGPTERVGARLERGLGAEIAAELREQPGALPLLQYALTELFERRTGRLLTRAAYEHIGGVNGALARRADELYDQLGETGQSAARRVFLRLVALGEGTEDTRRRVRLEELSSIVRVAEPKPELHDTGNRQSEPAHAAHLAALRSVLDAYGGARLLTFDHDPVTREPTVEVAHEALIRSWGRLRAWIDESRDSLRVQRRLTAATAEWVAHGYSPGFLASGGPLEQFDALAKAGAIALNAEERAYFDASALEHDRREAAERERQQRELAQAQALAEEQRHRAEIQATASQRLRRRAVLLAGALVVALMAGLAAGIFGVRAQQASQLSQARYLAAEGQNVFAERPLLGLRLMAEGLALVPAGEQIARTALISDMAQLAGQGRVLRIASNGRQIVPSPDGSRFVLGREGQPCELRRSADGGLLKMLDGGIGCQATFSSDSRALLVQAGNEQGGLGSTTTLRRSSDGALLATLEQAQGATFSPDGRLFFVGYSERTKPAELRRSDDGAVAIELRGSTGFATFSPDSRVFLANTALGTDELRRVADGTLIAKLPEHASAVSFSPDSSVFLASFFESERPAELRRTSDGGLVAQLNGAISTSTYQDGHIENTTFSPNSAYLVVGYLDNTQPAELWSTRDGKRIAALSDAIIDGTISFAPDSSRFGIAYLTRLSELRRTADGMIIPTSDDFDNIAFSPDGAYVLSNFERPSELHRADDSLVARLAAAGGRATFSPDGGFFLISYSNFLSSAPSELRRTSDGALQATLAGVLDYFRGASFNDDVFIVHFDDKQDEIWSSRPQLRHLAPLGLGFEGFQGTPSFVISPGGQAMVARYATGDVDLLDLEWLRAMGGNPASQSAEELVRLACAGPFASSFWSREDQLLLEAALGSWGARACGG